MVQIIGKADRATRAVIFEPRQDVTTQTEVIIDTIDLKPGEVVERDIRSATAGYRLEDREYERPEEDELRDPDQEFDAGTAAPATMDEIDTGRKAGREAAKRQEEADKVEAEAAAEKPAAAEEVAAQRKQRAAVEASDAKAEEAKAAEDVERGNKIKTTTRGRPKSNPEG